LLACTYDKQSTLQFCEVIENRSKPSVYELRYIVPGFVAGARGGSWPMLSKKSIFRLVFRSWVVLIQLR